MFLRLGVQAYIMNSKQYHNIAHKAQLQLLTALHIRAYFQFGIDALWATYGLLLWVMLG